MTSDAAAPATTWWDKPEGDRGTDPDSLALWRRVVATSGLCANLSEEDRRRARHAALELARAAHRSQRWGTVFGVSRLIAEFGAVVVAVRGLTAITPANALIAALVLCALVFGSIVLVAQLPSWLRSWQGRGAAEPALGGGDLVVTALLALAAWGVTVGAILCRVRVGVVQRSPFLDVHGSAPVWGVLPRWSWFGVRPDGGAGTVPTLMLIGASAAVVHLGVLIVVSALSRYRQVRRSRRDPVVGVVQPVVELLDLLTPDDALRAPQQAARAVRLLKGIVENLLLARHPSAYPDPVPCEELAFTFDDLSFRLYGLKPWSSADAKRDALRDELRDCSALVLQDQLRALYDDAGRVQVRRHPRRGRGEATRAAVGSLMGPVTRADGFDPDRVGHHRPGWLGLAGLHVALIGVVGVAAARTHGWSTSDVGMLDVARYVAACGAIAMLLIESVRAVLSVRAIYHRGLVRRWLASRVGPYGDAALQELDFLLTSPAVRRYGARPKLLPPGDAATIYDLPAEQFLAQVDFIVEHVMPASDGVTHVAAAFLGSGRLGSPSSPGSPGSPGSAAAADPDVSDEERRQQRQLQEQEDRSRRLVSSMNHLQTSLTHGWLRQVRLASCWLSGGIGLALAGLIQVPSQSRALFVCLAMAFGGLVAEGVRRLLGMVREGKQE